MRAFVLCLFASPLVAAGCVVVTTPPPEAGPTSTAAPIATATATTRPTATATADPTPTADPAPTATATATATTSPNAAQRCGSRGHGPCPDDQFCNFPAGSECGAADQGGVCQPTPQACTREYRPVCGCDGQTYSNACSANAKGVSVAKTGKCN